MIGATIKTEGYLVTDENFKSIAIIGRGLDSRSKIRDAIADHIGCDPEALEFEEEYDRDGWTGDEVALLDGAVVARVILP